LMRGPCRPRQGLPAPIEQKLLALDTSQSKFRVRQWGFEELRRRAFERLRESELTLLLGPVPSRAAFLNVQVPELRIIIDSIVGPPPPEDVDLRPVPVEKLSANGLSAGVLVLIKQGMWGCETVRGFFDKYHDPTLGDRVTHAFRREYQTLRTKGLAPDDIF